MTATEPITHQQALLLSAELRTRHAELQVHNSDLKRVQKDLEISRDRFFELYNFAPIGHVTVDARGLILESNLRVATLLGATHSSLSKKLFRHWVAVNDRRSYDAVFRRLVRSGAQQVCEVELERADGAPLWGQLKMSPSLADDSQVFWIMIVDITEQKLAELQCQALINHSPSGVSIVDEEGRYVAANPAMRQRLGLTADSWIGKQFSDLLPQNVADRLRHHHESAIADGESISATETVQLGGEQRVLTSVYFPFPGPAGKLVGSFTVDITEEETQRLKATAAEAATKAQSDFLSAMSHEIRNPLNGVIGMTSLLLNTGLSAEQLGYAQVVADSAEALLAVVDNVLDFSKIEAGKVELDEVSFDLKALMDEALRLVSFKALEKSLELTCSYPPEAPRQYLGDARRLRQVLMNFLSNAVKFTESGSVVLKADVLKTANGVCTVYLSVADTGIGISADKVGNLFARFMQTSSSIAGQFGGSGLGLCISKGLIELMGGEVGACSTEGTGSTFYCSIPLRIDAATAIQAGELAGISIVIASETNARRSAVSRWCQRWQMQVQQCNLTALPGVLHPANRQDPPVQIVIVDGGVEDSGDELTYAVRSARDVIPKLVRVSSSPSESFKDLSADAVLSTPLKASVLRRTLCRLVAGNSSPVRASRNGAKPTATHLQTRVRRASVLVVDDSPVNQKLAGALLSKMGCQVDCADDGRVAVEKVQAKDYDLVLMDCVMPNMDGFTATQAIRRLAGKAASVAIVALTASATVLDRDRCLTAGMNDFLAKPVRSEHLASALAKWIGSETCPAEDEVAGGSAVM